MAPREFNICLIVKDNTESKDKCLVKQTTYSFAWFSLLTFFTFYTTGKTLDTQTSS